jgi:MFS superfamily sulfate permease-like transporter
VRVRAVVCVVRRLYGCAFPVLVYSLFGTSRVQAMGPTALDSILTFSTMGSILKTSVSSAEHDIEVVPCVHVLHCHQLGRVTDCCASAARA